MCKAIQDMILEAEEEVVAKKDAEKNAEIESSIRNLLANKVPVDVIISSFKYPREKILRIAETVAQQA